MPIECRIEPEMRQKFKDRARALAVNASRPTARTVGLEAEFPTVSIHDGKLVEEDVRDSIIEGNPESLTCELGAAQLEMRTPPLDIDKTGLAGIEAAYRNAEQYAARLAADRGAALARVGSYPGCRLDQIRKTKKEKYELVPKYHDDRRGPFGSNSAGLLATSLEPKADAIALMNSVQFNVAVRSPEEAVKLLNLSLSIVPVVSALTGNARFLEWKDTGYEDIRMVTWERTHDARTLEDILAGRPLRVGNPNRYFNDFEDYLAFAGSFPFILNAPEAAFEVGIGLCWMDARVKVCGEILLVEFRPVSIQPSAQEDVAVLALFLGLTNALQDMANDLPPAEIVRLNRYSAMRRGLDAEFIDLQAGSYRTESARDAASRALSMAEEGLRGIGCEDGLTYLEILNARLNPQRGTPSAEFARKVAELRAKGSGQEASVESALRGLWVKEGT